MTWIEEKRVVVTGATSGTGKEIATSLAALGAHVVLACRDARKAATVAEGMYTAGRASRVAVMTVDTSDQSSIRAFAGELRERYGTVDVLVNNAGVMVPDRRKSVDGIELTFATNVLGYHLLTTELLPALKAGAPSRVVNVASTFAGGVDLDDLEFEHRPYDGMAAYAQSKACNRMLTWALARRLRESSVTVNAMAPGLMLGTRLYRDLPPDALRSLQELGGRSVREGAETAVWLASSPELDGVTGGFFEQGTAQPCQFRDVDAEEGLWRRCEELVTQLEPQR